MLSAFWNALVKHLEKQPYWEAVQPFFLVLFGTVAAEVAAFKYVQSQYRLTDFSLFIGSYLSVRIIVCGAGVLLLLLLFRLAPGARDRPDVGRVRAYYRAHRAAILFRGLVIAIIATAIGLVFTATSPSPLSRITIRLMDLPDDVRSDALTYLIYEMNRVQRQWYFDIDARPFNPAALTSSEREACDNPDSEGNAQPMLCYAETWSASQGPLIAITAQPLNNVHFATHRGAASVITTADAASIAPVTNYEYLAYMTVLQSMLIQFDTHGTMPADAFAPGSRSSGGVFEFAPSRDLFKPAMLAPRLHPSQEALIFNRFGPQYLRVSSTLLSLEWLYAPHVKDKLAKLFGVTLSH